MQSTRPASLVATRRKLSRQVLRDLHDERQRIHWRRRLPMYRLHFIIWQRLPMTYN